MAREFFRATKFRDASRELLTQCNEIVEDYQAQGLRLTLRQLYYQLVSKNIIVNSERSYQNLSALVSNGRLAARMDWDAIEDRVRQPRVPNEFKDLKSLVRAAEWSYRLPRWRGQRTYCELWVEKDALAGVLTPLAREYHATLMVNRGYSSQSAMYESAKRFLANRYTSVEGPGCPKCYDKITVIGDQATCLGNDPDCAWEGSADDVAPRHRVYRKLQLFYLGDHDPSGEDMVRDIQDRMDMFHVHIEVIKIGLTMAQVKKYNPPPNPAKITDPRAKDYIAKYGPHSWEVDALPPNVLTQLIRRSFEGVLDMSLMDAVKRQEIKDKDELRAAVEAIAVKTSRGVFDDTLLYARDQKEDGDAKAETDDDDDDDDE